MLANRTSRWSIGAALLCIALLAASWFLLISPRRANADTVRAQVVSSDTKANSLELTIAQLKVEFAGLPKRRQQLKAIKAQLPPKANIPALVRQLQQLAQDAGVSLDSVTPGGPTVVTEPGVIAPTTAGPGSVVMVPLAIDITGDYFEDSLFVKNLQTKIKRSYLITGIGVTSAKTTEEVTATSSASAVLNSTASPSPSPFPSVSPTVAASPTVAVNPLARASLAITGSVYVLLDGTSTLDSVSKDAAAVTSAQPGTTSGTTTPTTGPTAPTTK